MKRRIAVVTGTRAEYGVLRSVLRAIVTHPRLELHIIATGMHLLPKFGSTVRQITADGFSIAARVRMQNGDDEKLDQARGLGRGVTGIAEALERTRTDVVVVLGDRIEALAGALAGMTTGRIVAHVHGGDVAPGDFDDSVRHAITKLAHVHFAATKRSAGRILRLGEDRWHVHCVGAPGLDELRPLIGELSPASERAAAAPAALIVQHAYGRSAAVEERTTTMILNVARAAGLRRIVVYPNSDRGHRGVIKAIEQHARRHPHETVLHRSLPRETYLRTLGTVRVLIGNSSSGIIEAPLLGTPSIDVGDRQAGREPGGRSVLRAAEASGSIRAALERALRMSPQCGGQTVYGDGRAGVRIAAELARLKINSRLLRKHISY